MMSSPVPGTLILDLGFGCNLSCVTCRCPEIDAKRGRPVLSKQTAMWLIGEFARLGGKELLLFGGEPLLISHIYDVIAAADSHGLHTEITTNGLALNGRNSEKLLRAGVRRITISIDGEADGHDAIRGGGSHAAALRGASNLIEKASLGGFPFGILDLHCTISRLNVASFAGLVHDAFRIGFGTSVSVTYFSRVRPEALRATADLLGRDPDPALGHWDLDESLLLRPADIPTLHVSIKKMCEEAARLNIVLTIDRALHPHPDTMALTEGKFTLQKQCTVVEDTLIVGPEGQLSPCPMLTDIGFGTVDGANAESIFLDRSKYVPLSKILQNGYLPICSSCCNHENLM